jgi:hypothetical protein
MKEPSTVQEVTEFLNKYCPGLTISTRWSKVFIESDDLSIFREINGSDVSLKLIAYEYAFTKHATEKFEHLEFPTHIYRLHTEPGVEFSLCEQKVQCDVYVPLARDEQDEFEITLDKGTHINGLQLSSYFDYTYQVTLSRVDTIDPLDTVEDIQEQARDLVDDILNDFTEYASHKN